MSRLNKLANRKEKIEIQGIELEISPMTMPQLVEITELEEKGKKSKILEFLVWSTLRKSIPQEEADDATLREQIEGLPMDFATELLDSINRINGLDKDVGVVEQKE